MATLRMGVRLPVDAAWRKLLTERDLKVAYTVRRHVVVVRWNYEGIASIKDEVVAQLRKIGIEGDLGASVQLRLRQTQKELGRLRGLREENLQIELTTVAELLDRRGRQIAQVVVIGKGIGTSKVAALRAATAATEWKKVAAMIRENVTSSVQTTD